MVVKAENRDPLPPSAWQWVNTGGIDGENTGEGVKRSSVSNPVAKATVGHLLGFISPLGKEKVGSRWHLKALPAVPGTVSGRCPVTELCSSSSTGSFPSIHLIIMSGCQAGEPPSKELLRFYSKFCKFFCASWLQMRLYIARVKGYRGTRQGRDKNSGRVHGVMVYYSSAKAEEIQEAKLQIR